MEDEAENIEEEPEVNLKKGNVHIINEQKIYLNHKLHSQLELLKQYLKKGFDGPFLLTGDEGSGKSTLALIIAWYLTNGNFSVDGIIEGTSDSVDKLEKAERGSVLILDEGSLLLSSKDVMTREQKALTKILQIIRQKNLVLIIVAPSIFDLSKYIVHRCKFLIHVYTKGLSRGRFQYFKGPKKNLLYLKGKKEGDYNCVQSSFTGRFTDFKPPFYKEYLKTKERSLLEALRKGHESSKPTTEQDLKVKLAKQMKKNNPNLTVQQIADTFKVSRRTIFKWFKAQNIEEEGGGLG